MNKLKIMVLILCALMTACGVEQEVEEKLGLKN